MIRDAIIRGGGDTWSVPEFLRTTQTTTSGRPSTNGSKRHEMVFENHPTTGAHFHHYHYFGGVEYATNYRFETGNRLDSYEDRVSSSLNRILRHNVGKASESQSLFCDDAGCPSRTCSNVSQFGGMRTIVGHTLSSPQRGKRTTRAHGNGMKQTTA